MAIVAQEIADRMRFALDAENADHYGTNQDIIPAINAAIQWITSVINATIGEKKLGEEIFRDLTRARVFRCTEDSRVSLDVFPDEPWTILAVYPKPETGTTGASFTPSANGKISEHDVSLYHKSSTRSAKRLTIEEWSVNIGNPFAAGYKFAGACDELTFYAYLDPFDYNPDSGIIITREIEIRPVIARDERVTIFYVKRPTPITQLADVIEYPDSVFNLLFNKALAYISYKQGDKTTLNEVSAADIAVLINTIS